MEKTEKPTPKRLKKAREEGETYCSKPFEAYIKIFIFFLFCMGTANLIFAYISKYMSKGEIYSTGETFSPEMKHIATLGLCLIIITTAIMAFLDITIPLIYRRNVTSSAALRKGFENYIKRINPISLLSKEKIIHIILTLLKIILFLSTTGIILKNNLYILPDSIIINAESSKVLLLLIKNILIIAILIGVLISTLDLVYEKYKFRKRLYMTKQEIKEEYKNEEGDPHIKSQQKRQRERILFSDPRNDVKKAKFVLVNPTHIAIPIIYEEGDLFPHMGYIGVDESALKMISLARIHSIPIVKNIKLAREFFRIYETGDEIGEEHFEIIAEILSTLISIEYKIDYVDMDS